MSDSPDDPVSAAYALWASLDPDMRGSILYDLVAHSSSNNEAARQYEKAVGVPDIAAQAARRRRFGDAYEAAFMILAHAGEFPIQFELVKKDPA